MTTLSVNVNKIALLRNTRTGETPDVLRLSRLALEAGAHGITVHPRPDERHIRRYDVTHLAAMLHEPAWADREFNIEGNPFLGAYVELCREAKPDQCTLVPDSPDQRTSDHGWQLADDTEIKQVTTAVAELKAIGSRVSLFMDPDPAAIERVPQTGADRIELYTEAYADAMAGGLDTASAQAVHRQYADAAALAQQLGLGVNGGHDLNLHNLARFLTIPDILEVSIGHALIADALELGLAETVRAYLALLPTS
ncbi:pyridoxine 5'-phosphate synthase [Phycisphaerales bacterium AB-hyl4]|uniref:Pyridoxine 5'-phosphate synthase n=1 Tax=Natronomicrosphaera hydrolytica TaxID=3242702 RepID=A0ABV4UBT8_9BACT